MKFLSRVVWSEGMHLGPHHFQTQSRYFEDTLWFLNSNLRQEPWGFLHFSLDTEALRNGLAILSFASGILPDGLIFDFPDCDTAPEPAQLSDLFASTDSEIILHLAIPPRQDQGLDCDLAGGAQVRYGAVQRVLRDDSVGLGESSVSFARKNLVLLSTAQLSADTVSFPIARIFRDGGSRMILPVVENGARTPPAVAAPTTSPALPSSAAGYVVGLPCCAEFPAAATTSTLCDVA